ncbi:MAG: DUF4403 family protein, partial [Saprospiraceae bacterium]|nr:DUF4403 family protein [Saprospiraceae bacterium]
MLRNFLAEQMLHGSPYSHTIDLIGMGSTTFNASNPVVDAVEIKEDHILLDLRLRCDIRARWLTFSGDLLLQLKFQVALEELQLKAVTELLSFRWINSPVIRLSNFVIPIDVVSKSVLKRLKEFIESQISQKLEEGHGTFLNNLLALLPPIYVDEQFFLIPTKADITSLKADCYSGSLRLTIGCEFAMDPNVGQEHLSNSNPMSSFQRTTPGWFFGLSYSDLNFLLNRYLDQLRYRLKPLTINHIRLRHEANLLLVIIGLSEDDQGTVHLEISPDFSVEHQAIRLISLKISQSKDVNLVTKSILWLAKSSIQDKISSFFPIHLTPYLEYGGKLARKKLQSYVELDANDLKISALNFGEKGLECYFETKLTLRLKHHSIKID